jgi:folate-binding protein YgfZ
VHAGDVSIIKLPQARYLIVAAASAGIKIETRLAAAATPSAETLWDSLDIAAGIPNVYTATQEQFVPQAVNFDLIGALSFNKGCYPGQEIVARAHYLGRVKQRMVRARLHASEMPVPGDKLFSQRYGDQASGMIVRALHMATDDHEVLAVVQSADIDRGGVHWRAPDGPLLQIESLPYPVN